MKLTVVMSIIFCLQATASGFSQNQRLSLEVNDVSLVDLFETLEETSEFHFIYYTPDIKEQIRISGDFKDAFIQEVLDECLQNTGLTYKIVQDHVIIKKAPEVRKEVVQQQPQTITIKGKVTDERGEPLPFVNVYIKGETRGVITDKDGEYAIEIEDKEGMILVASFIGFVTKEFEVAGRTEINIMLSGDMTDLSEVVVTGYQTLSRERATGAFDKLSVEHMEKPSSSISERLQGTMAGVNSTIRADGSIEFEIRGQSSFYADAQPLVVVDGFPIVQNLMKDQYGQETLRVDPFSTINPNDVESITVLKDAAAASIWGAKAANGVIVITTKKAKKGKAKVEFSSFWKVSSMLDLDYLDPRASSAETIEYEKSQFTNALANNPWTLPFFSPSSAGSSQSQAVLLMNEQRLGRISEADMNAGLTELESLNNRKQIEDNLLQNLFTQQYNLNINGGNEMFSNALSIMYEDGRDNFQGNDHEKIMVNFRNNTSITDWLDFEFSGMMNHKSQDRNGVQLSDASSYTPYGLITDLQPYDMLLNSDGSQTNLNHLHYYTPIIEELVPTEQFPYSDWSYNPIQELSQRDFNTKEINARVQAGLNFKLMKGLTFNTKIAYEHLQRTNKNIYKENSFTMRSMVNETSSWITNADMSVVPSMPNGGGMTESSTTIRYYNWRNQLNFNRTFNEKHAINFIAGTETSENIVESVNEVDVFGFYNDERISVGRLLEDYSSATSMWLGYPLTYASYFYPINIDDLRAFSYNTSRLWSVYGNMSYTFNDKYSVTGSVRNDASNLVADDPKYRYSPFYSTGVSWQMAKENFLSDLSWLDRLTVRLTVGEGGNFDPTVSFMPLLALSGTADRYTKQTTGRVSSFGNPDLRWERTRTTNLGVDFAVLGSKLNGSVEVYRKRGYDLIVDQSIPSMNGTTNQDLNNGVMINKGIELRLGAALPIMGNDIKWYGNFNFSYNKNEITEFFRTTYSQYALSGGGTSAYSEGMDANTLWSFDYAGLRNVGTEADPVMKPVVQGVGDDVYPITTWAPGSDAREYMVAEGTTVAPYIVGFQNSFKIYDFNLSFLLTGKFGHKYRRHSFNYAPLWGGNTTVNDLYSEVKNGDPNEIVPIPESESRYYFYDRFVPYMSYLTESASHIRFQEINLTYNLPNHITQKLGLNGVQAYVQGNNLGTMVWNDYDEDPEYPIGTMKPQTTYTFGLKVNL
ncbi:SusC/RagA family TonB-linked outer membrane protein [Saccharicrinis sp. 156]|uniref:SusC/RagA family TonB-linked outer membrane protein n=1 Tax=Saccharicrinis sp. 156 TaxID=3417574 RepID=UPI003D351CED